MSVKCPDGYIRRKSYKRKTSSGRIIKVVSNCIKAISQSGKKRTDIDKVIMGRRKIMHCIARTKFPTPKCSSGEILREGYKRKSYKKQNGKTVSSKWISPSCIKSRTGRPHGKQLFVLDNDGLGKYGYFNLKNLSKDDRKEALNKALKDGFKPVPLLRRLVAIATLNKNLNPNLHDIIMEDVDWLRTTPEYKNRESKRKSKRGSKKNQKIEKNYIYIH